MTTSLDTDVFRSLRQLIAKRCGVVIPDTKSAFLHAKLADHLNALDLKDFAAYFQLLSLEPAQSTVWQEVFRRVTTNETYFFRNSPQIKAFTDLMLPEIVQRQRSKLFKRVKIWSAACSSGEEGPGHVGE